MPILERHRQSQTSPLANYANNPLANYANNPSASGASSQAVQAQSDMRDGVLSAFDTGLPDEAVFSMLAPPAPDGQPGGDGMNNYANNPLANYANNPQANQSNTPLANYANNPLANYSKTPAGTPVLSAPAGNGGQPVAPPAPQPTSAYQPFRQARSVNPANVGEDQRTNPNDPRGVRYYNDPATRRDKFKITVEARLLRRGIAFDTEALNKRYRDKGKQIGNPTLGIGQGGQRFQTPDEWLYESAIWVCAVDEADRPAFYSHVCRPGRFHHSSLIGGGDVLGAGEWIVRAGKLWSLSANSGHYQPTLDFLFRSVLSLAAAFNSDTTVFLYDTKDDRWVYRPIREFIARPSDGGRYIAHPRATGGQWKP